MNRTGSTGARRAKGSVIPPEELFRGKTRPRIGLALGSGGARGWAHVGVCLELFEHGLRPHCVAGTSIGAIIGALAAAGRLSQLVGLAHRMDWQQTARLFVEVGLPRSGLLNGRRIERFLRELIGPGRIEDLPMPFAAVATDLFTEESIVLEEGDLVQALRASISIPGLFTPVREGTRWLVDGGLVNPLPVDVVRARGADVVIASEINLRRDAPGVGALPREPDREEAASEAIEDVLRFVRRHSMRLGDQAAKAVEAFRRGRSAPTIFDVLLRSTRIGENRITASQLESHPPEYLIQSPVGRIGTLEFNRGPEAIAVGRQAAREWLGEG